MDLSTSLVDALVLVLWLGAPALGACLIAGLFTGLLQSAASGGDAALSFVPRFLAALAALFLARELLASQLVAFTARMLRAMAAVGG